MRNEKEYRKAVNRDPNYRINTINFVLWLDEHERKQKEFFRMLRQIETEKDLYGIAVDFSIPIIMVKWFLTT